MRTSQMKLFSLLVVTVALVGATPDEDELVRVYENCMTQFKVKEEDFRGFPLEPLKSEALNCTVKCCFDKYKVMSGDGLLNVDTAYKVAKKFTIDDESMNTVVKETLDECSQKYSTPVKENELCKRSAALTTCISLKVDEKQREKYSKS